MKRIITLFLAASMVIAMTACSKDDANTSSTNEPTASVQVETNSEETNSDASNEQTDGTVGQTLYADFKTKVDGTAQEIADGLLQNPVIQFMPASMPVEPGFLTGFGDTEIKDFKEGVMFGPAIGTIPFVGYIFTLEDGADVDAFKQTLKDNADLRWNICTEAEELIVENEGNTVFFLMCPTSFEQADEGAGDMMGDMPGGMDMPAEDGIPAEDGVPAEDGTPTE